MAPELLLLDIIYMYEYTAEKPLEFLYTAYFDKPAKYDDKCEDKSSSQLKLKTSSKLSDMKIDRPLCDKSLECLLPSSRDPITDNNNRIYSSVKRKINNSLILDDSVDNISSKLIPSKKKLRCEDKCIQIEKTYCINGTSVTQSPDEVNVYVTKSVEEIENLTNIEKPLFQKVNVQNRNLVANDSYPGIDTIFTNNIDDISTDDKEGNLVIDESKNSDDETCMSNVEYRNIISQNISVTPITTFSFIINALQNGLRQSVPQKSSTDSMNNLAANILVNLKDGQSGKTTDSMILTEQNTNTYDRNIDSPKEKQFMIQKDSKNSELPYVNETLTQDASVTSSLNYPNLGYKPQNQSDKHLNLTKTVNSYVRGRRKKKNKTKHQKSNGLILGTDPSNLNNDNPMSPLKTKLEVISKQLCPIKNQGSEAVKPNVPEVDTSYVKELLPKLHEKLMQNPQAIARIAASKPIEFAKYMNLFQFLQQHNQNNSHLDMKLSPNIMEGNSPIRNLFNISPYLMPPDQCNIIDPELTSSPSKNSTNTIELLSNESNKEENIDKNAPNISSPEVPSCDVNIFSMTSSSSKYSELTITKLSNSDNSPYDSKNKNNPYLLSTVNKNVCDSLKKSVSEINSVSKWEDSPNSDPKSCLPMKCQRNITNDKSRFKVSNNNKISDSKSLKNKINQTSSRLDTKSQIIPYKRKISQFVLPGSMGLNEVKSLFQMDNPTNSLKTKNISKGILINASV